MTPTMTTMKKWQDEYLTRISRVEEPVLKFAGKAGKAVVDYVPERPQWAFLEKVPTMTEVVENQLTFRRRVIDEQAAFVRKLMKALTPAKPHEAKEAPKHVAKGAPVRRAHAA